MPGYRPARSYLAACLMALEDSAAAGQAMAQLKQVGRPSPLDSAYESWFRRVNPFSQPPVVDRLVALWQAAEGHIPGAAV
jgi:hypothetical protein